MNLPSYPRGSIVRITDDESVRIGVPVGRRWLVINSKPVRIAGLTLLCQITSGDIDGKPKRVDPTDLQVPAGAATNGALSKWSYICCSLIYTVKRSAVSKKLGVLEPPWLLKVDETLIEVFALMLAAKRMIAAENKLESKPD